MQRCGGCLLDRCTCRLKPGRPAPTVIAQRAQDARADREFAQAREELAKVAPETAAIVEGWARLWRPADAC